MLSVVGGVCVDSRVMSDVGCEGWTYLDGFVIDLLVLSPLLPVT
jgi:hypothetical protein